MARAPSVAKPRPWMCAGETPADFDGRLREVGDDVAHGLQADDADEGSGGAGSATRKLKPSRSKAAR